MTTDEQVMLEFRQGSKEAFLELFVFVAILVVGLVWVWAHGDLEWMKKLGMDLPKKD